MTVLIAIITVMCYKIWINELKIAFPTKEQHEAINKNYTI